MNEWSESVEWDPDLYCQIYLAEIGGEDPVYRYQRYFVALEFEYLKDAKKIYCSACLPSYGVYEFCARWFPKRNAPFYVRRTRFWFALIDDAYYAISEAAILPALAFVNKELTRLKDRDSNDS